jgi:hypothetical protein
MTSTFLVQIASVPGHQVGQRQFEQSRYLHELLVSTLTNRDDEQQIKALKKLIPQHEIVLRSGFSQTAQWGLEPNMFLEVSVNENSSIKKTNNLFFIRKIHGDENQARMISALFGEAFCQDGIGIGGGNVEGQSHSVLIINRDWENEEERLKLVSNILQHYPTLSAQLDLNGQLAFHDYSMSSSSSFEDIISMMKNSNKKYFLEEKQMKSELVDRTEYENLLMLLESSNVRHAFNILRHAHARLFSGYACASLTLPSISIRRKQKRREQRKDRFDINNRRSISPAHLCSLIFTSRRPCMCLTDNNCFCHYTLILTAHRTSSP